MFQGAVQTYARPQSSSGGITAVQNGLNLFDPLTAEWGGTLLRDTTIDQAGFNIFFNGGAFAAVGTTGDVPVSGSGARMMWVPARQGFRAGGVSGAQWDVLNFGQNSAAFNFDTSASGSSASAFGFGSIASGNFSFAAGRGAAQGELTFSFDAPISGGPNNMAWFGASANGTNQMIWGNVFALAGSPNVFGMSAIGGVGSTVLTASRGVFFGEQLGMFNIDNFGFFGINLNSGFGATGTETYLFGRDITMSGNTSRYFVYNPVDTLNMDASNVFALGSADGAGDRLAMYVELTGNTTVFGPTDSLLGVTTFDAYAVLRGSTASDAQMIFEDAGADPGAPSAGMLWRNGTRFNFFDGGATQQIAYLSDIGGGGGGTASVSAIMVGTYSGSPGLFGKGGDVLAAGNAPITSPFDQWNNNSLNPFYTPDALTINQVDIQVAGIATSTGAVGPVPLLEIEFFTVQSTGRTSIGSALIPMDGLNCGSFNNASGNNFQFSTGFPTINIPANSLWGWQFTPNAGATNINAARTVTVVVNFA